MIHVRRVLTAICLLSGCVTSALALADTAVAAPSAAVPAGTTVATLAAPTPVNAYGDRIAWSSYDPSTKTYHLMTRSGGVVSEVPVAPRKVPFDVDLGTDSDLGPVVGKTVAVYSRCTDENPKSHRFRSAPHVPGSDCDIYRYDFAAGVESKVPGASSKARSEYQPAVWGKWVAFAAVPAKGKSKIAHVYVSTTPSTGSGSGSLRTVRTGCVPRAQRCTAVTPNGIDIEGRTVAVALERAGRVPPPFGDTSEVRLQRSGQSSVVVMGEPVGLAGRTLLSPSFRGRASLYFGYSQTPEVSQPERVLRYQLRTRALDAMPVSAARWAGFFLTSVGVESSGKVVYGTDPDADVQPAVVEIAQPSFTKWHG